MTWIDAALLDARIDALRVDNMRLRAMVSELRSGYALRRMAAQHKSQYLRVLSERALARFDLAYARYFGEEKAGFNPDQPRDDHGQWTNAGGGQGGDGDRVGISAVRRRSGVSEAECDSQYKRDIIICKLVKTPLCYARAMDRYVACMKGAPIPPLNF
jgi:hypothetical protein